MEYFFFALKPVSHFVLRKSSDEVEKEREREKNKRCPVWRKKKTMQGSEELKRKML